MVLFQEQQNPGNHKIETFKHYIYKLEDYIFNMVTLREQYPLESIKPLKKTIGFAFLIIIVATFISIFVYMSSLSESNVNKTFSPGLILILVIFFAVLIIILKYVYEVIYMKNYFYDDTGDNLIIKKGVFSINEITLPYTRIQDVYVDQDILDRIFGLYDVHVSSATNISGVLSHIDGLNSANSNAVRDLILKKIKEYGR